MRKERRNKRPTDRPTTDVCFVGYEEKEVQSDYALVILFGGIRFLHRYSIGMISGSRQKKYAHLGMYHNVAPEVQLSRDGGIQMWTEKYMYLTQTCRHRHKRCRTGIGTGTGTGICRERIESNRNDPMTRFLLLLCSFSSSFSSFFPLPPLLLLLQYKKILCLFVFSPQRIKSIGFQKYRRSENIKTNKRKIRQTTSNDGYLSRKGKIQTRETSILRYNTLG